MVLFLLLLCKHLFILHCVVGHYIPPLQFIGFNWIEAPLSPLLWVTLFTPFIFLLYYLRKQPLSLFGREPWSSVGPESGLCDVSADVYLWTEATLVPLKTSVLLFCPLYCHIKPALSIKTWRVSSFCSGIIQVYTTLWVHCCNETEQLNTPDSAQLSVSLGSICSLKVSVLEWGECWCNWASVGSVEAFSVSVRG